MATNGGLRADDQEESLTASINTTPLVDVMLVLLIIFLITIPVVTHTVPVALPHEVNRPTTTKPDDIIITVDKDGNIYWNDRKVTDNDALLAKLKAQAIANPQPEVHIRADRDALYEFVGRIVVDCQRAGIERVAFITQPQPRGANTAE